MAEGTTITGQMKVAAQTSGPPATRNAPGTDSTDGATPVPLTGSDYELAHGEKLSTTLDLETWRPGADLVQMYERLAAEVTEAVRKESEMQHEIRARIFPILGTRTGAPPCAGVFRTSIAEIERIHSTLLFTGGVEAVDGTVVPFDTLPVTITQIGVVLVSYQGDQGSWAHRIYRRDLRTSGKGHVDETLDLLERRSDRSAVGYESKRDRLSDLARRGIMAYAERAILLDKGTAPWRLGHGSPVPYELLTGSGLSELLIASLDLLSRLIEHKRFLFVPSATNARELLTIGNALRPLEYALVDTNRHQMESVAAGHYRGTAWSSLGLRVEDFIRSYGDKIVVGIYRASAMAPAQVFYAHADYAHEAALVAIADSILQEHRGFPTLIELADGLCGRLFGAHDFAATAKLAYAQAGAPYQYLGERATRK